MKIITFDVEHGSSHIIRTPNDQIVMIDAGSTENFSPARYLKTAWNINSIRWFTLTHHDADHLTDINEIIEFFPPETGGVRTLEQPTLSELELASLYADGFSTPLEVFSEFKKVFTNPAPPMGDPFYDWGGVQFATFGNKYSDFQNPNINDLSVVTFAQYQGWTLLFPGDLEKLGWRKLLGKPEFCEWLQRVDIFVASHHGRESGFCEEVFSYSSPKLVIMSDKSQSETSCPDDYRPFVQGLSVINAAGETNTRKVLTTRSDGALHIYIDPEGRYQISTSL